MTLTPDLIEQAATELLARRTSTRQGPRLPASCRPETLEDGWLIQQAVTRRLAQPVGGWKTSLPSPGKQVAAPKTFGKGKYKAIEPAPGRYVKAKA